MLDGTENKLTLREYAKQEGITIQSAYRRIWDGRVEAERVLGRWLITPSAEINAPESSVAVSA